MEQKKNRFHGEQRSSRRSQSIVLEQEFTKGFEHLAYFYILSRAQPTRRLMRRRDTIAPPTGMTPPVDMGWGQGRDDDHDAFDGQPRLVSGGGEAFA